ncbi:MAG: hypothetical protein AAFO69_21920, partial [Bacteroidota bacterium]
MRAQRYYMACKPYYWRWEDEGEVIAIPDGSTLIFSEQLLLVIKELSPLGLPPFGVLLLLNTAASTTGERLLSELKPIIHQLVSDRCSTSKPDLGDAWDFLEMVNRLPDSIKTDEY